MPNSHSTASRSSAGGIEPDDHRYVVEVHDQSTTDARGNSLVVEVIVGNGHMTYAEARAKLNAIGRRHPELHQPNSGRYLAVVPAHRGSAR